MEYLFNGQERQTLLPVGDRQIYRTNRFQLKNKFDIKERDQTNKGKATRVSSYHQRVSNRGWMNVSQTLKYK